MIGYTNKHKKTFPGQKQKDFVKFWLECVDWKVYLAYQCRHTPGHPHCTPVHLILVRENLVQYTILYLYRNIEANWKHRASPHHCIVHSWKLLFFYITESFKPYDSKHCSRTFILKIHFQRVFYVSILVLKLEENTRW